MTGKASFLSSLATKKTLLVHNYDLFLERQTRLASILNPVSLPTTADMDEKRELLILDDLTIFAISARRLIDLCGLQTACDKIKIREVRLSHKGEDFSINYAEDQKIGFYALLSRIIHMSFFEYFDSRRRVEMKTRSYNDLLDLLIKPLSPQDAIEGVMLLKENKHDPIVIKLRDVIFSSIEAADKITDICSDAGVFMELWMKNS